MAPKSMGGSVRASLQDVFAAAIGTLDLAILTERKVNARVAERPVATVTGDGRGFDRNDLERFHFIHL